MTIFFISSQVRRTRNPIFPEMSLFASFSIPVLLVTLVHMAPLGIRFTFVVFRSDEYVSE